MTTPACAGCLGNGECWICSGTGCRRCAHSGACHVCTGGAQELVPHPRTALEDQPLRSAAG